MERRKIIVICDTLLVILAATMLQNRAVVFQQGNPIPYLIAAVRISENSPFVAVDESYGIYISKRAK